MNNEEPYQKQKKKKRNKESKSKPEVELNQLMGNWEFPVKRGFQNQMECGEYNLTFNHQTFILILYNSVPVL